jgi:hypothetical protein
MSVVLNDYQSAAYFGIPGMDYQVLYDDMKESLSYQSYRNLRTILGSMLGLNSGNTIRYNFEEVGIIVINPLIGNIAKVFKDAYIDLVETNAIRYNLLKGLVSKLNTRKIFVFPEFEKKSYNVDILFVNSVEDMKYSDMILENQMNKQGYCGLVVVLILPPEENYLNTNKNLVETHEFHFDKHIYVMNTISYLNRIISKTRPYFINTSGERFARASMWKTYDPTISLGEEKSKKENRKNVSIFTENNTYSVVGNTPFKDDHSVVGNTPVKDDHSVVGEELFQKISNLIV